MGDSAVRRLAPEGERAFGKYTLIAKIGHGGMAEVYLAARRGPAGFAKLCVLKRLHAHLEEERSLVAMFLDEARLAARLDHPNVVQTYEVGEVDGVHFLTMELLEGQSLARLLRRLRSQGQALPVPLGLRFFIDVLAGLHYAHTLCDYDGAPLGIVHRDVSPTNVFVTYEGQAKLLDFGIAKAATHLSETRHGQLKGKFAYAAPEQASGEAEVDPRADLWSLGVTMWEAFAGRPLFEGESEMVTLHRALHAPIPPLASVAEVPAALGAIVDRALRRPTSERYGSAQEMKEALEHFAEEAAMSASREELGRFVARLFEPERLQQRAVLEAWMRGERSTASLTGEDLGVTTPPAVVAAQPTPRHDRRKAAWLFGGVTLLLASVFGAVHPLLGSRPGSEAEAADGAPAGAAAPSPGIEPRVAMSALDPTALVRDALDRTTPSGDEASSSAAPSPATPDEGPSGTEPRRRARAPVRASADVPARRAPASTAAPRAEEASPEGLLTLDSHPWAEVFVGDRHLGTTPLIAEPLPAGSHLLILDNPERGIRTTYRVTIRPGETTTRRVALR